MSVFQAVDTQSSPSTQSLSFSPPTPVVFTVIAVLISIAIVRIVSTYSVFNHTFDEPVHILRGVAWWRGDLYAYPHHPPLGPLLIGIGPSLLGAESKITGMKQTDANRLLYEAPSYWRILAWARAGNLVFLVACAIGVWAWGTSFLGRWGGVLAVGLLTTQPTVLAHAALATTDMAAAATMTWLLWAWTVWIDSVTLKRTCWLGLTGGLALTAKFSVLLFTPVCILAMLAVRVITGRIGESRSVGLGQSVSRPMWWRGFVRTLSLLGAAYLAFLTLWVLYRTSFGPPTADTHIDSDLQAVFGHQGHFRGWADSLLGRPVPAPEFVRGVLSVARQNSHGHASFFLGRRKVGCGSWAYFPVVLLLKTPVPFWILCAIGGTWIILDWRRNRRDWRMLAPLVCPLAILSVALPSDINIGVRHVLPVYPLLSIVAAAGVLFCWRFLVLRCTIIVLLGWYIVASLAFHPDYLTYYNVLARGRGSMIAVDSDLDWGQDLARLGKELRRRGIGHIKLAYFGSANPDQHDLPTYDKLRPYEHAKGWIAISVTKLRYEPGYDWLESFVPVGMAGRSIRLYWIE